MGTCTNLISVEAYHILDLDGEISTEHSQLITHTYIHTPHIVETNRENFIALPIMAEGVQPRYKTHAKINKMHGIN